MISQRRQVTRGLRFETLEGRVVLNAAAQPLHAAAAIHLPQNHVAQVHATAHKASTVPNPVLVNLTPNASGITITDVTYDARIHLITVKGTVDASSLLSSPYPGYDPIYPVTSYLGLYATQAVTRFQSVTGYQYSSATIANATMTKIPFSGRILASAGMFQSGMVNLTVTSENVYDYSNSTFNVLARMRNVKAY